MEKITDFDKQLCRYSCFMCFAILASAAEGNYYKPEEPNGYKFELLVLDMIHLLDNCLSFEVVRNREFAPIKNKTGVDSVETPSAVNAFFATS